MSDESSRANAEALSACLFAMYQFTRDSQAGLTLLELLDNQPVQRDEIERHLLLAADLGQLMSRRRDEETHIRSRRIGLVILDRKGTPVEWNTDAAKCIHVGAEGFASAKVETAVEQAIQRLQRSGTPRGALVNLIGEDYAGYGLLIRRGDHVDDSPSSRPNRPGDLVLLIPTRDRIEESLSLLSLEKLTDAECRVVKALAGGLSLEAISESHRVSTNTVRSQLKSVFQKTGFRRQSELVLAVTEAASLSRRLRAKRQVLRPDTRTETRLTDGRIVESIRYGANGGHAVIAFPGTLESGALSPQQAASLEENNLTYHVFRRPGFGNSSPVADYCAGKIREDVAEWSCRNNIDRFLLHGRASGAIFALACGSLPGATGILLTNSCLSNRIGLETQQDPMIASLRVLLKSSYLIRPFARIFSRTLTRETARSILDKTYQSRAADRRILEDEEEIFERLVESTFQACTRSWRGAADELVYISGGNFEYDRPITAPIKVLHGMADEFSPVDEVCEIVAKLGEFEVETFEDAGQLMGYSHWAESVAAMRSLAAR